MRALDEWRGLSPESRGRLPQETPVAHKTGTSRTVDGVTAATNDIGIVKLPDGPRVAVAVFVSDSPAEAAVRERVIADVAFAAYQLDQHSWRRRLIRRHTHQHAAASLLIAGGYSA